MRSAGLRPLVRHWESALFSDFELTPVIDKPGSARRVKRVLVLSVSAGSGHVRAAEALLAQAAIDCPQLQIMHRDVLSLVPSLFRRIYADWYLRLADGLPEAWGWLYRKTDRRAGTGLADRLRRLVQRASAGRLFDEIDRVAPDAIVCTHFLPAELLASARQRGLLDCPVWVQVTDFDLHQLWVHEGISGYAVANDELAYRLERTGVPAAQILVSGIPVMPAFLQPPAREAAAAQWRLDPSKTTVLMMGGGAGVGLSPEQVKALLMQHPALQLIVLAGRNARLLAALQAIEAAHPERLRAVGFTDQVPALMACADLVITKPGGLSTSECLVMGLPMLLVNPIPGQEERNAALLLQEGAAQRADDPATLQFRLERLLSSPDRLAQMRARARALGRPDAARALLQRLC